MQLIYVRDVGLVVAGPGLATRATAIEASTQRTLRELTRPEIANRNLSIIAIPSIASQMTQAFSGPSPL